MDSHQTGKSRAFEYFLYLAVIAETGLAALIYKVIFDNSDLARLRLYFAIFYFAFLAWAIQQLHKLHRDRANSLALPAEKPAAADTRFMLGLTGRQFVIIFVVFATAVAAFSWVLRLLL
jgi:hypothetical protein